MIKNNELKFYQEWERTEGSIVMENAKTIDLYLSLKGTYNKKSEMEKITENPAYFFAAFNNEQFKEGYDKMKPFLAEGEKIISIGAGCFFSRKGLELYNQANKSAKKRIKEECDPQEVYCYEWNNHECMFTDDAPAVQIVLDYFGKRAAKSLKRLRAYSSVELIISENK